jgi:hypothetical protein
MIPILIRRKIKLSKFRNCIFESIFFDIIKSEEEIIIIIIDVYIIYVEIRNITDKSIINTRKKYLEIIEKYGIEEYYLITEKLKFLVIERILWVKKILIVGILVFAATNLVTIFPDSATIIIEMNILKSLPISELSYIEISRFDNGLPK